jgi:elongation factor 1-gamma
LFRSFDKEGFSVWRCDFKYNDELTLVFMSSNQIGGFFNRLEASRKHLFGSLGVLGEAKNSVISGVFITRGNDIILSVDCAPDWESYEYKKLDLTNESDKKFFEDALAWDLELDGKKWADGKNVSPFALLLWFSAIDDPTLSLVQVNGCFTSCRLAERSYHRVLSLCQLV